MNKLASRAVLALSLAAAVLGAGCTQMPSNRFSRSSLPLATQFSATPPARHRFFSPVVFAIPFASLVYWQLKLTRNCVMYGSKILILISIRLLLWESAMMN
mgnify:CR=1 FL=1